MTPDLERFSYDDAWQLGSGLLTECRAKELSVTIGIRLGEQRVFHAALPGTSSDNDSWVDRKSRIVQRFRRASLEVARQYVGDGNRDVDGWLAAFALDPATYFPAGGAVPILVRGCLVGVLCVSGLESEADHQLAVDALTALARSQADPPGATDAWSAAAVDQQ